MQSSRVVVVFAEFAAGLPVVAAPRREPTPVKVWPSRLAVNEAGGWRCFERSVAASGRTLALVRPRRSESGGPERAPTATP